MDFNFFSLLFFLLHLLHLLCVRSFSFPTRCYCYIFIFSLFFRCIFIFLMQRADTLLYLNGNTVCFVNFWCFYISIKMIRNSNGWPFVRQNLSIYADNTCVRKLSLFVFSRHIESSNVFCHISIRCLVLMLLPLPQHCCCCCWRRRRRYSVSAYKVIAGLTSTHFSFSIYTHTFFYRQR